MTIWEDGKRRLNRALGELRTEKALHARLLNISHLLTGNFGNALLNLGSVALTARTLGPAQYGVLALVTVYVLAIERLLSFQTWQPMIRYGAELEHPSRHKDLKALIKFVLLLDLAAAATGWMVASSLAFFGSRLFGWEGNILTLALIYSLVLLTAINGTPVGILRLAERFKTAAYVRLIAMALRLILCVIAFVQSWSLLSFVIIWASTHMLGNLLVIAAAGRELHQKNLLGFFAEPLGNISRRFPKIWRFSFLANISVTIRSSAQQFDTLMVGALVDPAAAGFYHIAKRVAKFAEQAGAQVQSVVFPEVAKIWSAGRKKQFRRVVKQTELLMAGISAIGIIVMYFLAELFIRVFAGAEFLPAAPLLTVQIIAVALVLNGSTSRVALLAMGKEVPIFYVSVAGVSVFFLAALLLLPQMGAMGANVAHILNGLVWVTGLWWCFNRAYKTESPPACENTD